MTPLRQAISAVSGCSREDAALSAEIGICMRLKSALVLADEVGRGPILDFGIAYARGFAGLDAAQ